MASEGARKRKAGRASNGGAGEDKAPLLAADDSRKSFEATKGHPSVEITHAAAARAEDSSLLSNALFWLVTALSFVTRFHAISWPDQVVFDEVHFGKFASYYLRRTFYFDVHPPLGRLLIAAWGYINNYSGHFDFKEIGLSYVENKVPYIMLRTWPALCGALVVPLAYETLRDLGFSTQACFLAGMLIVLDNSLAAQSRLILLDSMLMVFMSLTLFCWVKFSKRRREAFSFAWWAWLTATGVSLGLVMGIKMVGLFTVATVGVAVLVELWYLLDAKRTPDAVSFVKHFAARAACLIALPCALYLTWFWIHFAVLTKTGSGDAFMSPEFQATLTGNKLSGEAMPVVYGANVTLRHLDTRAYLHSHVDKYPLEYEDGRVSSQGQQVTAYAHSDANNLWRLKPAAADQWESVLDANAPYVPVRHGDEVVLEHVMTKSHLLTHDVASPWTTTNTEFTTLAMAETTGDKYNNTVFRIEIEGPTTAEGDNRDMLKTLGVKFRLVHKPLGVAMLSHKKPLPEWGFKQQEINGSKKKNEKATRWIVEESKAPKKAAEFAELPKDSADSAGLKKPSFLAKFVELQTLMITQNAGLTKPHPYQSPPHWWPTVLRGISFWQDSKDKQIYLIPNPTAWWFALAMIGIFAATWAVERIAERRGIQLDRTATNQVHYSVGFLFIAWAFHYFPFFLMGRSLFLHHYLPAAIVGAMLAGAMFDFVLQTFLPRMRGVGRSGFQSLIGWAVTLVLVGVFAWTFWFFFPLTYGTSGLTVDQLKQRKWLSTWDFQYSG